MAINLYSLGAAEEVTGSKHLFEVNGKTFMVDCGAFQGHRKESDRKNREFDFAADKLEAVILTHAHYDHCGLLPVLIKNGFKGNIYATSATRDLANLVLMDSAHIQARDAEYLKKQAKKRGEIFDWEPLFSEKEVVEVSNHIITLPYNRKMMISEEVELEFFDSGHILGSAMALVTLKGQGETKGVTKKDLRILYSGDLGRKNKAIIRDPDTNIPAFDYLFLESTYGDRPHKDMQMSLDKLAQVIRRAVEKKGKVIIPAFAIERTQELIYHLHLLVDEKKIPKIPIYVDSPMATNATAIFQAHPECYDDETHKAFLVHHKNPFGFNELSFTQSIEDSKNLNDKPGPMIIISADGMCEAGRIVHHVANNISNPNNTILIVGYMAEYTLGRKILDGVDEVKIMYDWYKVNATIEKINAFSAHTDCVEAVEWLKEVNTSQLKNIFIVHGEKRSQLEFVGYLEENGFKNTTIVKRGKHYTI